jgi:hypothetical protein
MLNQLARLTVQADGRYATREELQFLRDYIESLDLRVSAYQKIQAAETTILNQIETQAKATNPKIFYLGSRDGSATCNRDRVDILRNSAAAVLSNDLDHLRESVLLWYRTIIEAYQYEQAAKVNYRIMQEVVKKYLSPQEAALISAVLGLNQVILGK